MTVEELKALFHGDVGWKGWEMHAKIGPQRKLYALNLLSSASPGRDIIVGAKAGDLPGECQIYLDVDMEGLARIATPETVAELSYCAAGYHGGSRFVLTVRG